MTENSEETLIDESGLNFVEQEIKADLAAGKNGGRPQTPLSPPPAALPN